MWRTCSPSSIALRQVGVRVACGVAPPPERCGSDSPPPRTAGASSLVVDTFTLTPPKIEQHFG